MGGRSREIADHVGVRHSAAYRHFTSKEDILSTLAARAFTRLAEHFGAVAAEHGDDIPARLKGLAQAYLTIALEEPGAYRVMFANLRKQDDARNATARRSFDALIDAIADGQRLGIVRNDMPATANAASNWAGLHGLTMLLIDKRLEEDGPAGGSEALFAALLKVQRNGWLTHPTPRAVATALK